MLVESPWLDSGGLLVRLNVADFLPRLSTGGIDD